ncbi:MAG: carboxypeptidase-like regulatory domain-containing protein [Candidatus Aegiribacteria sp.]|nr:carboxypeptidase-like regulatory domain-containing protein [Candidatus Aegiribacteria sp.]
MMVFAIASIAFSSEESCSIEGTVSDSAGNPLIGATVMVVGTPYGAMTYANGGYSIINLEPGVYSVQACMVGMQASTISEVSLDAGSETELDFTLTYYSYEPIEYSWPLYEPPEENSLQIELSPDIIPYYEDLALFVHGSGDNQDAVRILPELEGNTFTIGVPSDTFNIVWSLPFTMDHYETVASQEINGNRIILELGDRRNDSPQQEHDPSASGWDCLQVLDEFPDEWTADGYSISSISFNPWDYGDHRLAWAGFISYAAFFENTETDPEWQILLIYTDHLTVLEEGEEPKHLSFEMEILNPIVSLTGKYILGFQADVSLMAGEALLIDVEDMSSYRFDPLPIQELEEQSRTGSSCTITVTGPECDYFVSDLGDVFAYSDSITVRYSSDYLASSMLCDSLKFHVDHVLEDSDGYLYFFDDFLHPDQILIRNPNGEYHQVLLDSDYWHGRKEFSPSSSLLLAYGTSAWSSTGICLNDMRTGQNIWHAWASEPINVCVLSRNAEFYLASLPVSYQMNHCIVAQLDDPEHPFVQFRGFTDKWIIMIPISLSSTGSSFWRVRNRHDNIGLELPSESLGRFALISESGESIWATPIRDLSIRVFQYSNYFYLGLQNIENDVFSGNRIIWDDGRRIYITSINETHE